jgi:hypothetical protein
VLGPHAEQERSMTNPPAGYYVDPTRPGTHRWWDGTAWAPLDALGATFSALTAVVERSSVSIPAGYYEHPAHPGSVTWWNGSTWADVAIVPGPAEQEVVDVEVARQVSRVDDEAPPPGDHIDPDDADDLRWWDGAAWERATVAASSPVLTIDGRSGMQARPSVVEQRDTVSDRATEGPRRSRRARERRRARLAALLGLVLVAGAVVGCLVTR